MHEAGLSLGTVRLLDVALANLGDCCAQTATAVDEALLFLAGACSALTAVRILGMPSSDFICGLGKAAPLLSDLSIRTPYNLDFEEAAEELEGVLQALPSTVTCLRLPCSFQVLPDLSQHSSVTYLEVQTFKFDSQSPWLCLPSSLQHLRCRGFDVGPPPSKDGQPTLSSLVSVEVCVLIDNNTLGLDTVARILNAAPALQAFHTEPDNGKWGNSKQHHINFATGCTELSMDCPVTLSAAADLSLLYERIDSGLSMPVKFIVGHQMWTDEETSTSPLTAALPGTERVTSCCLYKVTASELGPALALFPNLRCLELFNPEDFDDLSLQEVGACQFLTKLELWNCDEVTAVGLYALSQRLFLLCGLVCNLCDGVTDGDLDRCELLLAKQGRNVRIQVT